MGSPDLHGDESVILTTPDVFVKSIPFEAILTSKRIILIDQENDLVPQKDILLATIRDVQPGENAIHDMTISLAIIATTGETRQIVLTFFGKSGGKRKRERDEWVQVLKKHTGSSLKHAISTIIPGLNPERKTKSTNAAPVRTRSPSSPLEKRSVDTAKPQEKIAQPSPAVTKPIKISPLPAGLFCSRCGNRAPPGSLFCTRCGEKIIIPLQESHSPAAHAGALPAAKPSQQPARAVQTKKESRPVLPKIFRREDRLPEPGSRVPPSRGGRPGGLGNKTIMIIAVIAVLIIAIGGGIVVFTYFLKSTPATQNGTTDTGTKSATPTPTFVFIEKTAVPIPEKGVWVRVNYLGMWSGSYGTADVLQYVTGSGEYLYEIANPNKTIQATFKRADTSTRPHELVVGIYKNGELIKQGVTTIPQGSVDIAVDPNTAKPISALTTGK